jgi:hypothetical protein
MKVLADLHHTSLYSSLVFLFEERLGYELYRPIGMQWWESGFWSVWDSPDTAKQYLSLDQGYRPVDGTPPLNQFQKDAEGFPEGVYACADVEYGKTHKAATLNWFANSEFSYVVASIPQHVPLFQQLIAKYNPQAKLLVQLGNHWSGFDWAGLNILASLAPQSHSASAHVVYYHQEYDKQIFYPSQVKQTGQVNSYINILQNTSGGADFLELENLLPELNWRSYGGQCREDCITGAVNLADSMRDSEMIFHVKPGGDGYGYAIHTAYAVGRPVITRRSHYHGKLAERLMLNNTCVDLDNFRTNAMAADRIRELHNSPDELIAMGQAAADRSAQVIDFESDEQNIRRWLEELI